MDTNPLTSTEKKILLKLARSSLEAKLRGEKLPPLKAETPHLQRDGATFVTLTKNGRLRGCIGTLEAYRPLAEDVQEHAIAAALHDRRFPPVKADELEEIEIEISRLTAPVVLEYENADDLLAKLRPGIDGVILKDGFKRATYLPQVWEQLLDAEEFLNYLCQKMGLPKDAWRHKKLTVLTYQVEEFYE
ncbi:MAG: AmmeMemoRadiSam system protein A [Chloroflexi bacterium]|nr:AmmeMemoRadiSam system protein A [Chloroflexota bacterium]